MRWEKKKKKNKIRKNETRHGFGAAHSPARYFEDPLHGDVVPVEHVDEEGRADGAEGGAKGLGDEEAEGEDVDGGGEGALGGSKGNVGYMGGQGRGTGGRADGMARRPGGRQTYILTLR